MDIYNKIRVPTNRLMPRLWDTYIRAIEHEIAHAVPNEPSRVNAVRIDLRTCIALKVRLRTEPAKISASKCTSTGE